MSQARVAFSKRATSSGAHPSIWAMASYVWWRRPSASAAASYPPMNVVGAGRLGAETIEVHAGAKDEEKRRLTSGRTRAPPPRSPGFGFP
jgi:hypothetical protein